MNCILRSITILVLATTLSAQVPIGGDLWDGHGGPLLSGTVYHVTGAHLAVPSGRTLSIEAGAILKFERTAFFVDGTLLAIATSSAPIVFTSIHDDAAGGDTNGNGGASSPASGQWFGALLRAGSSASSLAHVTIRYGGYGGWALAELVASSATLTACDLTDGSMGGLAVRSGSFPSVSSCSFRRIGGAPAIFGIDFEAMQGVLDADIADCPGGNYARLERTALVASVSLGARNCPGGALVYTDHISVPAGLSLTLDSGVVMKSAPRLALFVDGVLMLAGTAARPVVLTSYQDDDAGGDTNGDGNASSPAAGQWFGIQLRSGTGLSRFEHAILRYGGYGGWPQVDCQAGQPLLADCMVSDAGYGGLAVQGSSRPSVVRCRFERIAGSPAVFGLDFASVMGFADNTATGCSGGDYLRVDRTVLAEAVTLRTSNCIGGLLVVTNHITVPAALTLTLEAGLIVKFATPLAIGIDGTLLAHGSAAAPVILTSIHDDAAGGDTNRNGNATTPAQDQWYGVAFRAGSDASRLEHATLRYGGYGGWALADIAAAAPGFVDCRFTDSGRGAVRCIPSSRPTLTRCVFERIAGGPAISGVAFEALAAFTDNVASACSGGNFVRVETTQLGADATVTRRNLIDDVLVYSDHIVVPAGRALALGPGIVLKPSASLAVIVQGRLDVAGPTVFTSMHDDTFGGDTNQNGNTTSPAANQWFGIQLAASATGRIDQALIRWAGYAGWPGLDLAGPAVILQRSRVEFCGYGGFALRAATSAEDLIAFANLGHGFQLLDGAFPLLRASAAYNSGHGVRREPSWVGVVRSSLAYGNGAGFVGFAIDQISFSNGPGIVGGSGNLDLDPRFVAAGAGDLRLAIDSPLLDRGDPLDATIGRDALGFPRVLDGDLDGTARVDIGANEFDHVLLFVTGDPSPGGVITPTTSSSPAILFAALALGLPLDTGLPLLNFGPLFVDPSGPFDIVIWPTNGGSSFTIPATLVGPQPFAFQAIGLPAVFPAGNTSNPVVISIE